MTHTPKPTAPQLNATTLDAMIAHAVTHPQEQPLRPTATIIPFPRASALTAVAACALLAVTFWFPTQQGVQTPATRPAPVYTNANTATYVDADLFFDFQTLETLDSLAG